MPDELVYTVRDRCFELGAFFVGATGGAALAVSSGVHKTDPIFTISNQKMFWSLMKKMPYAKHFVGSNAWVRFALQGLGAAATYGFLECKFQRGQRQRTVVDAALAGAITGGAFGLRGKPGGIKGAGYGAGGFALYALIMQLVIR